MAASARSTGPFPELRLADLEGVVHPLEAAWRDAAALVLIGHGDCSTTRLSLPFFERIHRRHTRGSALLVLQDEAGAARELRAELDLSVPIRLEPAPYPLAEALGLVTVPTFVLVDAQGQILQVSEGLDRERLETLAQRLGVEGPLFTADDRIPAFRPG